MGNERGNDITLKGRGFKSIFYGNFLGNDLKVKYCPNCPDKNIAVSFVVVGIG